MPPPATARLARPARILDAIADAIAFVGKMASWLIVPIVIAVLFSIGGGILRVTEFASWEGEVFLLGNGVTLNSVLEIQWHLFGVLLMLTGAYALHENRHVRVDVVSARFSPTTARVVEIIGDAVLLLPLCVILIDRSLPLLELAWRTGERSNENGLTDRWLIKMFVPLGFALIATLGVTRIARNILTLMGAPEPRRSSSKMGQTVGG